MAVQLCRQMKDGGRESEKHPAVLCSLSRAVFGEPSSHSAIRGAPCPPGMGLPSNPCCDQPWAGSSPLEARLWPKSENQFQSPAAAALGQLTSLQLEVCKAPSYSPTLIKCFHFCKCIWFADSGGTCSACLLCTQRMPPSNVDITSQSLWSVGMQVIILQHVPMQLMEQHVPYVALDKIVPNYSPN